jgi:hypothetical protein
MSTARKLRARQAEAGIALLISIFILLLISVVAISLIVSSGTETALAGNYRSSTGVYYAALAGLEEARSRLRARDPNSFKTTWATFYPAPGNTLPIGTVGYVLNPGPTESAGSLLATYPDTEYDSEFGAGALVGATVKTTLSVWNKNPLNTLPFPGPLYKWVRINAVSELSMNLDTYPYDTSKDPTPLYFDGTHLNDTNSGKQVFEITALAVLPNASGQSSQKLVQYLAAPAPITLPPFLAALTIAGSPGNGATFTPPDSNPSYFVKGNNEDCNGNPVGGSAYAAVGVFMNSDIAPVKAAILPASMRSGYTGIGSWPDVENIGGSFVTLNKPSQLNAIVQTIIQDADYDSVPTGDWTVQTAYLNSLGMSPSNMRTVVAKGDLDLSHWSNTGYGLLLVTGTYTFDPDNGWRGIILVIGRGKINNTDNLGNREIDGAVFVAKTNSAPGVALPDPNLGAASVLFLDDMEGEGIRYSSCWIQKAQPMGSYKILSFHEISQ